MELSVRADGEAGTSSSAPAGADLLAARSALASYLEPDEHVLDTRAHAVLTRVTDNERSSAPFAGALFLTDRRLLHQDGEDVSIELSDIEELTLAGDRILVTLAGLKGLIVETDSAADFRSNVAAAISALRARQP